MPDLGPNTVYGCDFSHYHPVVSGIPFKNAGHGFGICKASEGGSFRDHTFNSCVERLQEANVPAGAYHFYRFANTALENANNFIGAIGNVKLDLPPVLDLEDLNLKQSAASAANEVLTFLDIIEKHYGVVPIHYTGNWYFEPRIQPRQEFARNPLWIASYTTHMPHIPKPWSNYWAWQFTDHFVVSGAPGSYDCSATTVDRLLSVLRRKPHPTPGSEKVDAPDGTPGILHGDSGSKVVQLQACLNYAIGSHLVIDGKYGSATAREVANVQKFFGLKPVSGDYGPKTQWCLQVAVNNKAKGAK